MDVKNLLKFFGLFVFFLILHITCHAQWINQCIPLSPGWNSVFIEVQPEPDICDQIFHEIPIESVWLFNTHVAKVQFINDPADMTDHKPDWMVYYPPESKNRDATNLYRLIGGRAYLIKVSGNQNVDFTITGKPETLPIVWSSDSKNFVGFCIDESNPPTFADFFESSPAHAGQPIFRFNPSTQKWEIVQNPASERMMRGEAFWIHAKGVSQFQGPFKVTSDLGSGLEFGKNLAETHISIKNLTNKEKTVTLRWLASTEPIAEEHDPMAGNVPLSWYQLDFEQKIAGWQNIDEPVRFIIKAGRERFIPLKVRRNDMAPPSGFAASSADPLYQSILELTDETGFLVRMPVSARLFSASPLLTGSRRDTPLPPTMPYPLRRGLWVGIAKINAVCETNNPEDSQTPRATANAFSFPVILHIDSTDQPRLLNEVFIMSTAAVRAEDPDHPGELIITEPPRYVLLTEPSLISKYEGIRTVGNKSIGRRLSSAAFGTSKPDATQTAKYHHNLVSTQFPVKLVAMDSATSAIISCEIVLDYDDPLNPFKHKFHPDHDNLSLRFDGMLDEGKESYQITRTVGLEFKAKNPEGNTLESNWGDAEVGGIYHETLSGIHKNTINVSGTFILKHTLSVENLNDILPK